MTAVARSNYDLYTTSGVKLDTTKFGAVEGWKPYRGQCHSSYGDISYNC